MPWEAVRSFAIVVESPGVAQSPGSGGWGRSKLPRLVNFFLAAVSFYGPWTQMFQHLA